MKKMLAAVVIILGVAGFAPAISAASFADTKDNVLDKLYDTADEGGYDILQDGDTAGTDNALIPSIGRAINLALAALGTVAVILVIYAGFLWMSAGGNEDQIAKAKTIIKQVVVGLIVLSLAYAIVSFAVAVMTPKPS